MTTRQRLDAATGRPEIQSTLAWAADAPPVSKRLATLVSRRRKQQVPSFQPRASYLGAPSADELRAVNSLRSIISRADGGGAPPITAGNGTAPRSFSDDAMLAPPSPSQQVDIFGRVKSAKKSEKLLPNSLRNVGRTLTAAPENIITHAAIVQRPVTAPTNVASPKGQYDIISLAPKAAVGVGAQGKRAEPMLQQGTSPQKGAPIPRQKTDIFGRPVPLRPPSAVVPAAAFPNLQGAQEHYRKLLSVVTRVDDAPPSMPPRPAARGSSSAVHRVAATKEMVKCDIFGRAVTAVNSDAEERQSKEAANGTAHRRRKPMDLGGGLAPFTVSGVPNDGGGQQPRRQLLPDYIANPAFTVVVAADPHATPVAPAHRTASAPARASSSTSLPVQTPTVAAVAKRIVQCSRGWGLRFFRCAVRRRDTKGNGILCYHDLRQAALQIGVEISKDECEDLRLCSVKQLGVGSASVPPGSVFLPGLLDHLRAPNFNTKRDVAVRQAFRRIQGCVGASATFDEILAMCDLRGFPEFQAHMRDSARKLASDMRSAWGDAGREAVAEERFVAFWRDVSGAVLRDDDFSRMMQTLFLEGKVNTAAC